MSCKRFVGLGVGVLAVLLLIPGLARAQNGAIAGVIRDSSGGVLPGVTVEAASPALIEKVRSATTDGEGQYKILDLRPGIYSVTFALPGFKTVVRDALELNAGGTLNITADLEVGAVEERITVTGQTPQVDIQNVQQHQVITRQVIEALPTGRTLVGFTSLIPGVKLGSALQVGSQEVGGNIGESHLFATIHGSRSNDSQMLFDGMRYNNMRLSGGGTLTGWLPNGAIAQEVVADTGGHTAEAAVSGPRTNPVPKEGGNAFRVQVFSNYTGANLQATNITEALIARGAAKVPGYKAIWEINPTVGGPILRDKLWFFGSYRYSVNDVYAPGAFYTLDPSSRTYAPDRSRPAVAEQTRSWYDGRLTWQASPRHKLALYGNHQLSLQPNSGVSATTAPEASRRFSTSPAWLTQLTYNAPLTNRLLIEAGGTWTSNAFLFEQQPNQPFPLFQTTDLALGITYRASSNPTSNWSRNVNTRAKVSYVTGSHAFAVGLQTMQGRRVEKNWVTANDREMTIQVRNGVPVQVTVFTTPYTLVDDLDYNLSPFVQDQWTLGRMTMIAGARLDLVKASRPEQHLPATLWVGARDFPGATNLPNWKDINPRLGVAYDLFGNGRTALKGSIGRYVQSVATGIAEAQNPIITSVNSTTRPWTDLNGDFYPQDSELGPLANPNFGRLNQVTTFDPDYLTGWGKRWYNWETQLALQQQLRAGLALNVTYTRHTFHNMLVNDNVLVSPSDYSSFCVTAPTDARLSVSGQQVCGFYDINPNKFGQFQNVVGLAKDFGKITDVYSGVDVTLNVRLPGNITLQGGTSTGREITDVCDVAGKVDNVGGVAFQNLQHVGPAGAANPTGLASPSTLFCRIEPPLMKLTDVKFITVVPLPWWGLTASATFQSSPGPEIVANYVATNAQVAPTLGRDLSGRAAVTSVRLVGPGTLYGDRINQLDFRGTKAFTKGRLRVQAMIDAYNLLNVSPVLTLNNTLGAAWQRPTSIMPGRTLKFGTQVDF